MLTNSQPMKYSYTEMNNHIRMGTNGLVNRKAVEVNGKIASVQNGKVNGSIVQNTSKKQNGIHPLEKRKSKELFEVVPLYTAVITYIGFYMLLFLGYLNQLFFTSKSVEEEHRDGYVPLYDKFEHFYSRYVYRRVRDCWNRPICSVPGAEIYLKDRVTHDYGWTFEFTGTKTKCLNLGSYNYLGFAESDGFCARNAIESVRKYGLASCSPRNELGTNPLHKELEALTAKFVGTEAAIVFGMGFATNSLNLPCLISPGCLVLSDEKNHASIILGLRLSGATIKVFNHNNVASLEAVLRENIIYGQPRTRRPWRKILIVVEGIYSMEGSVCKLPEIIALKKKYKAYLYVDEAHSIGALGKHGRGVADYYGCDPKEVDILMGTFTKSFAGAGGYIAGSKELINYLRANSHAEHYASSMSPPVAQQILSSMKVIMGQDGTDDGIKRISQLAWNTSYFRKRLHQMGLIVYGNEDSPVVPMLVYMISKIGAVIRNFTTRNIAAVGVAFPATPLMEGRIRFCLSAAHTKEQLDQALNVIEEMADELGLRYSKRPRSQTPVIYGSCDELQ